MVLRTHLAFSFLRDVDAGTGVVNNPRSDIFGEALNRRILVLPRVNEHGIDKGTLVLLKRYKGSPAGILAEKADDALIAACEEAETPLIDGVDCEAFRTGDSAFMDGENGIVELEGVALSQIATSVLFNSRGELLVVRRSGRVGSYRGVWSCISGYVEEGEMPEETAVREMREETGMGPKEAVFIGKAEALDARDKVQVWEVHPCAFLRVGEAEVTLDWENEDFKWSTEEEIKEMEGKGFTVPRLAETVRRARVLLETR